MVGGVRTSGFVALLVVLSVVLAAAAVPLLSGHTPLEAFGPESGPDIGETDVDSDELEAVEDAQDADGETADGLLHEDFASLAGGELGETMSELTGVLSVLFGADGLEGALGDSTALDESDLEDEAHDETETEEDDESDDQISDDEPQDNESRDDELQDDESETDEQTEDDESEDSSDDEAAGSDTDSSGDGPGSLLERVDLLTVGLVLGGLVALAAGWFAYRTGRSLLGIVLSIPTLLVGAVARFVFGITAVVERVARGIRTASSVFELPGLFVAGLIQSVREISASVRSLFNRGQPTVDASGLEQLPNERQQIREAWRAVIDAVAEKRYRRRTPGEIKQQAIDRGLPEPPLSTLVGLFRDVEYGAKDPTDRAEPAVSAATELTRVAESIDSTDDETPAQQPDHSADSQEEPK